MTGYEDCAEIWFSELRQTHLHIRILRLVRNFSNNNFVISIKIEYRKQWTRTFYHIQYCKLFIVFFLMKLTLQDEKRVSHFKVLTWANGFLKTWTNLLSHLCYIVFMPWKRIRCKLLVKSKSSVCIKHIKNSTYTTLSLESNTQTYSEAETWIDNATSCEDLIEGDFSYKFLIV